MESKKEHKIVNEDYNNVADVVQLNQSVFTYVPGGEAEKKLQRKIDMRLIPTVWLMYFLSYLDRGTIGNAREGGMERDLNLTDQQYSIILLIFFVSYVLCEPPSNAILARVKPHFYLPGIMVLWGGVALCFMACTSWQGVAVCRFFLGVLEAGFSPGVIFLLSSWYPKHLLGKRFAIYYTAVPFSGMFAGLLAGLITQHLDGAGGLSGWKWLFCIEGAATIVGAIVAFFILPDFPSTTKWLSEEEKFIAVCRLEADGMGNTQGSKRVGHKEAIKLTVTDWRTWSFVLLYMFTTGSQTIQYFIPTLVKSLGYTGFHVQYMTIPIYAACLVAILAFCFSSDWFKERGTHVTVASSLGLLMLACTAGVTDAKARYVFLTFGVAGIYSACPLVSIWSANSIPHPAEKRALVVAIVNGLGNSASIYSSYLFPSSDGPKYTMGLTVTTVFMASAAIGGQVLKYSLKKFPYPELEKMIPVREVDENKA